jgi:hypothetical protein
MLSSQLRPSRSSEQPHRDARSPFASPFTSPEATRHNLPNERRRVAADFDDSATSGEGEPGDDINDEEDQETDASEEDQEEEQEDVAEGEDGMDDTTPLLPIFSAAHLGTDMNVSLSKLRGWRLP